LPALLRMALAAVLLLAGARAARGDEPVLVADRQGFGESAITVPKGRVQAEAGAAWTRIDSHTSTTDLPQLLIRVGLLGPVELRVLAPDYVRTRSDGQTTTGWSDTAVGLKVHLGSVGGSDFTVRATADLPTGSSDLTARLVDPEAAVAWSRSLSERWSLGATVAVRRSRSDRRTLTSPSLSIGRSLGERVATFVEYGASVGEGLRPLHRLDHGYTWLVNPRTQLDASLGVALSSAAPDFFVGVGWCRRF
jgi:outer membrane putative beta-barrel porin/alpha-amylase